ncbi:hypothetical protein [Candidatus Korobacter versatilis]|uniref:hypothetical protein n=1 Tax=Candidatus Korobacter versatilis TaxID=658062 RepID=UPI00032145E8|nr:hypothetical protein [Candidatus Koribacter versatilis]
MGEFATAKAPIRMINEPIVQEPARGFVERWVMIACAEILSALTNVERVGRDPLLAS